jgi:hypothetical protein
MNGWMDGYIYGQTGTEEGRKMTVSFDKDKKIKRSIIKYLT